MSITKLNLHRSERGYDEDIGKRSWVVDERG